MITNAGAGTSDEETLSTGLAILREHGPVEVAVTCSPGELDEVLPGAQGRRIVVAGGDGSLHSVVSSLHRRGELAGSVLGLLPLGTGNDFARTVGIPLEIEGAAGLLVTGKARPVDLLTDDVGGVVVNNVHAGAGAQASRRSARWKTRLGSIGLGSANLGKLGYPIGALQASFLPPSVRMRVEVDGIVINDLDQPTLMVAIGNGASVGGGAEVTPAADPEDGRVDVMVSRAVGPLSRFGFVFHLSRAEHRSRDDVIYLKGRAVRVSGEEFYAASDGEIAGPLRRRTWTVHRGAYSMVLP